MEPSKKEDRSTVRRRQWREAGLCAHCGGQRATGNYCDACRAKMTTCRRENKQAKRKDGRCAVCGVASESWRCLVCSAKESERLREAEASKTLEQKAKELDRIADRQNKVRQRKRLAFLCARCGLPSKSYCCSSCQHYSERRQKKWRHRVKAECIEAYGGCCACCGEKEPAFLTMDHSENDGKEHRKSIGRTSIWEWLRSQGYPKKGFQMLCYNCNMGRAHSPDKVCPHKTRGTAT